MRVTMDTETEIGEITVTDEHLACSCGTPVAVFGGDAYGMADMVTLDGRVYRVGEFVDKAMRRTLAFLSAEERKLVGRFFESGNLMKKGD